MSQSRTGFIKTEAKQVIAIIVFKRLEMRIFTNADDIKQNLHLIDGSICFITDETGSDWWIAYEGFKRVIARLEENPDQKVEMYKPEYPVFKWEIHFLTENNSASFKFKDDFASGIVPKGRIL